MRWGLWLGTSRDSPVSSSCDCPGLLTSRWPEPVSLLATFRRAFIALVFDGDANKEPSAGGSGGVGVPINGRQIILFKRERKNGLAPIAPIKKIMRMKNEATAGGGGHQ